MVVGAVAALSLASHASAATFTVGYEDYGGDVVSYYADPGEENDVTVLNVPTGAVGDAAFTLSDPGAIIQPGTSVVPFYWHCAGGGTEIACAPGSPKLRALLADGDDSLQLSNFQEGTILDGGPGNDRVHGGGGYDDIIGGPGRDELRGGGNSDEIHSRDGEADDVACDGSGSPGPADIVTADPMDTVASDCETVWVG